MNDKKAKRLRAIARLFREKELVTGEHVRYGYVQAPKLSGEAARGPVVIDPNCEKGVYRELKRRARGKAKFALPQPKPAEAPVSAEPTAG